MDATNIIILKIKEHETEIEGCNKLLPEISTKEKSLEKAQKIMILKDKIMFHKAALATLKDLQKEIDFANHVDNIIKQNQEVFDNLGNNEG